MTNAFHYQHTFDDELAQEFRKIFSAGFDPTGIEGLQLWLDSSQSDAFSLDAQNHIEQWRDYSGNERHAVQGNIADRPIISSNPQNGIAGVFFDYAANKPMLISSYIPGADDSFSIFVVAKRVDGNLAYDGGSIYKVILSSGRPDGSAAATEVGKINVSEHRDRGYPHTVSHKVSAWNGPEGLLLDGKAHLLTSRFSLDASNNGYSEGRSDRVTQELDDFSNAPDATETLPLEIGGSQSASSRRFWGTIYEVLFYDRLLPDEEMNAVEIYLMDKWALDFSA